MAKPREIIVVQSEEITSMSKTKEFKIVEYPSRVELKRLYYKDCRCLLCALFGFYITGHKQKAYWSHFHSVQNVEKAKEYIQSVKEREAKENEKPINEILI